MDENLPETQSAASLVPPSRVLPAALAPSASVQPLVSSAHGAWSADVTLRGLAAAALDRLDLLGDRIANAVGLR